MKAAIALALLSLSGIAQAHTTLFLGTFAPEAVGATGGGTLKLEYNDEVHTLFIEAIFSGLSGTTTNAHIHCCTALPNAGTAGVALGDVRNGGNRLTGFPLGVTGGTYTNVLDLTAITLASETPANTIQHFTGTFLATHGITPTPVPLPPAALTQAEAEALLIEKLTSGNAYFNIHTSTFGGGEIRTFVTAVPEASTWLMMALGLGLVGGAVVRRRSAA